MSVHHKRKLDAYIRLRGSIWYYVRTIPKNLWITYKSKGKFVTKKQIWESLGTEDIAEAYEKAKVLTKKYDLLFERERLTLSDLMDPAAVKKVQQDLGLPARHHTDFPAAPLANAIQMVAETLYALASPVQGVKAPQVTRAVAAGTIDPHGIRLSETVERYCALKVEKFTDRRKSVRDAKILRWKRSIDEFIAFGGDLDIREITPRHAAEYKAYLVKKVNNKEWVLGTAIERLAHAKMIVRELLHVVYDIQKDPFHRVNITRPKGVGRTKETSIKPLLEAEMLVVNGLHPADDIRAMMDIAECTGVGITELVGVVKADIVIDHKTPHLLIRTNEFQPHLKNDNRFRAIPLVGKALDAFKRYPSGFKDYQYDGGVEAISTRVRAVLRRAGIKKSWNSFRHRFEDLLRNSGAPDSMRSELMGHSQGIDGHYGDGSWLQRKRDAVQSAMDLAAEEQAKIKRKQKG